MAEQYWKELRPSSAARFRLNVSIRHDLEPSDRDLRRPGTRSAQAALHRPPVAGAGDRHAAAPGRGGIARTASACGREPATPEEPGDP